MVKLNQDFIDEEFVKSYNNLNEFLDVPDMLELRDLLVSLKNNERYIYISKHVDYDAFHDMNILKKEIKIFRDAEKGLGDWGFIFSKSKLSNGAVASVHSIILYSCVCEFQRELTKEEKEKIYKCDLVHKLTLGQENFLNIKNYDIIDKDFFKNINKIKWNKRANKLNKTIYNGYWYVLSLEYELHHYPHSKFGICADYLACCRVYMDGRDEIMPEDLVKSWLLTLKLFLSDLRPYIFNYNESQTKHVIGKNSEKEIPNLSRTKKGINKILAAILSILLFIFLLFIILILIILLVGDAIYSIGRWPGLIALGLCAYIAKRFYIRIKKD